MTEKPSFLSGGSSGSQETFDVRGLREHIDTMGYPHLWEKSYLCPCRDPISRQPRQSCKTCSGRGIAYFPPKEIKIAIQSQERGIYNGDLGILDTGTAIGTPEMDEKLSFRDRITLKGVFVTQSFIFNVTDKRVENGFFMVYDVASIEFITTMDGEIQEGSDFTWDIKTNTIYPKKHLIGKNISMNIKTTLRYMVADLLKEHRYARNADGSYENTNQKLLLKREDIFVDKEAFDLGHSDKEMGEMIDTKVQPSTDGLNGFFRYGGNKDG